jgi:hypothetical protein
MRIECEITETDIEGIPSVCAECSRCGHETESYGLHEGSIKRCLVLMREECPEEEHNFYTADQDDLS